MTFGTKTRVHFAKRKNACARLILGDRSQAVRSKTSVLVPAATGRALFRRAQREP